MLLTKGTLEHLDDFIKICIANGIKHLAMIVPRPAGRAANPNIDSELPDYNDINNAARVMNALTKSSGINIEFQYNFYGTGSIGQSSDPVVQKITGCPAGRKSAFISPEGWF